MTESGAPQIVSNNKEKKPLSVATKLMIANVAGQEV